MMNGNGNGILKVNGSSWKFALIFLAGIVILAQLVFLIYWRWNSEFRHHQQEEERARLPSNWIVIQDDDDGGARGVQPPLPAPPQKDSPAGVGETEIIFMGAIEGTFSGKPEPPKSAGAIELADDEEKEHRSSSGATASGGENEDEAVDVEENRTVSGRRRIIPRPPKKQQLSPKEVIQELVCSKHQETGCYVVVDGPSRFGSGFARSLMLEPMFNVIIAEADLEFPDDYHFSRKEAANWPVKKNQVTVDYNKLLVAQPFITGTFPLDMLTSKPKGASDHRLSSILGLPTKDKHILCVGLHGSVVNNFFANLSTELDVTVVEPIAALKYIADKWFGMEEDDHHHVLIEDPANYLKQRAETINHSFVSLPLPKKYDLIIVDLCHNSSENADGICPAKEFVDPLVLENMRKNLAGNGTIAVNIFMPAHGNESTDERAKELAKFEHELLVLYKKHFKSCFFVKIGANTILTCAPSLHERMTPKEYHRMAKKLPMSLQTFFNLDEPKVFIDTGVIDI